MNRMFVAGVFISVIWLSILVSGAHAGAVPHDNADWYSRGAACIQRLSGTLEHWCAMARTAIIARP
jgi:hypothetical protein